MGSEWKTDYISVKGLILSPASNHEAGIRFLLALVSGVSH